MKLDYFNNIGFYDALKTFFEKLNVPINYVTEAPTSLVEVLETNYKLENEAHKMVQDVYFLGMVDDKAFKKEKSAVNLNNIKASRTDYDGLLIFGVELSDDKKLPSRSQLAEITRAFNREFNYTPVVVVFKYQNFISFANCERVEYKQKWREGEKIGKFSILKDIDIVTPHTGHIKILQNLEIPRSGKNNVNSFDELYKYWQSAFSISLLNKDFYNDLSNWYYYANSVIKLPTKTDYCESEKANVKSFTVRLICRLIFSWFLKERGLIPNSLLELFNFDGKENILVNNETNFGGQNSYYRGILQNIFFSSLNTPISTKREFYGKKYLPTDFDYNLFKIIPYLNGGLFDKLEEDYSNDRIEDSVLSIPNELFYGESLKFTDGKKTKETQGINRILSKYKFTIDENTPLEEEIALDPELLGLVFENLLAEIDPDVDISKTARKESGSFYTPRKIIDYMVNESLLLYFKNNYQNTDKKIDEFEKKLNDLIYQNKLYDINDKKFDEFIIDAIDNVRVLDPACGSGAFPMGILHRMVSLLKVVDNDNEIWLEKQLIKLPSELRDQTKKDLNKHEFNYSRKLGLIRNCIYGIDNQPMAVMITKLRFFISLLTEQDIDLDAKDKNYNISPLPNLETKIICADSLVENQLELFESDAVNLLKVDKEKYYRPDIKPNEKSKLVDDICDILSVNFPDFSIKVTNKPKYPDDVQQKLFNKKLFKEWFQHANICSPFFNQELFFPELDNNGFDIVIGNPPYGGTKIADTVKDNLGLGSKDPYGAFISRFLNRSDRTTPLKNKGILSFIVSDTFMTLKTHLELRKQIMANTIHKIIRVNPDTFKATVNTSIILCERIYSKLKEHNDQNNNCLMCDLTNISIHNNYNKFLEILAKTEGLESINNISTPEYAIYNYPQKIISKYTNIPFFVASPKLFELMRNSTISSFGEVPKIIVKLNDKEVNLVKLKDISDVKVGLQTGDNPSYIYQNPESRGTYKSIDNEKAFLLNEDDLNRISSNDKLRLEIIAKGISKDDKLSDRYFNGRYIIPYDKGGESDSDEGWMPNYYVPTNYFIDWSEWAVNRMKTLTIIERDGSGANKICSRFQNAESYFKEGISFSRTGIYSPTFRINSNSVYDTEGSSIIFKGNSSVFSYIGILSSKLSKFILKNFVGHTIHCQVDELKELPLPKLFDNETNLSNLVKSIISNQKSNLSYDYASNEQIEIDNLVYNTYGLNDDDIQEVENWYARRYPKLVKAKNKKSKS